MDIPRSLRVQLCKISAVLLLVLAPPDICRSQVTSGTLLGTVQDPSGAAIRGANVTATNLQTGLSRSVLSGEDGGYIINLLPVGDYSIRVEFSGFKTDERSVVNLQINSKARVDFILQVGKVSEKVEVSGSQPVLDTDTAESGQVIENTRVTQLPLNGRQFIQLTLLTPGVVPEVKGTLSSPLALSGLSVNANGARYEDNVFLLDGVLIRDEIYDRLTVSPSVDAIEEFKVHTSNYSAEFGGHGGAQINISTRSGTNAFHGIVYEFLRNDVLDARNFFDPTKPHFRQNQFGASLGGPIKQNRAFFFGNYEGSRIFKGITITSALPTDAMRMGNFAGMGPIIDPTTGSPFSMDQIPTDRIVPFAQVLSDEDSTCNVPGIGEKFCGIWKPRRGYESVHHTLRSLFFGQRPALRSFCLLQREGHRAISGNGGPVGQSAESSRLWPDDFSKKQKSGCGVYTHIQPILPE